MRDQLRRQSFLNRLGEDTQPLIMELIKKKRIQRDKEARQKAINDNMKIMQNPNIAPVDKTEAFSILGSLGVNLNMKLIQPKNDYTKLLKSIAGSMPDDQLQVIIDSANNGTITFDKAATLVASQNGQDEYTDEQITDMEPTGFFDKMGMKGWSNSQIKTGLRLKKTFKGKKLDDPVKIKEQEIGKSVYYKVNKGFTDRANYSAEEWAWINEGFKSEQARDAFLGKKYRNEDAVKAGIAVQKSASANLWIFGMGTNDDLLEWVKGTLEDESKVEYFDKYYDESGEINYTKVAEEGIKALAGNEEAISKFNLSPEEKVSVSKAVTWLEKLDATDEQIRADFKELEDKPFSIEVLEAALKARKDNK